MPQKLLTGIARAMDTTTTHLHVHEAQASPHIQALNCLP
jgi:hypothetical protein